jgi:hypothetical protein
MPAEAASIVSPVEWRILANGEVVSSSPESTPAPAASGVNSPPAIVVRMDQMPEGSLSVLCWNADELDDAEPRTGIVERHVALFLLTRELAAATPVHS